MTDDHHTIRHRVVELTEAECAYLQAQSTHRRAYACLTCRHLPIFHEKLGVGLDSWTECRVPFCKCGQEPVSPAIQRITTERRGGSQVSTYHLTPEAEAGLSTNGKNLPLPKRRSWWARLFT